jgi:hypothetical protein
MHLEACIQRTKRRPLACHMVLLFLEKGVKKLKKTFLVKRTQFLFSSVARRPRLRRQRDH